MYGIDLLVEEHENVFLFTEYIKQICCGILDECQAGTIEEQ